ncbi:hypothetical protein V2O64_04885 [Verrucomicrobiaceae bacterium 227]
MSTPEESARHHIDALLGAAGWAVQDIAEINLSAARGIAIRELRSQGGPADYLLFVDGKALDVVEAKKAGTTLSAVAEQLQIVATNHLEAELDRQIARSNRLRQSTLHEAFKGGLI